MPDSHGPQWWKVHDEIARRKTSTSTEIEAWYRSPDVSGSGVERPETVLKAIRDLVAAGDLSAEDLGGSHGRRLTHSDPCRMVHSPEPFAGYEIGKRYHLQREIWKSSPGFGINIGGIAPKGRFPDTEAVYILATIGDNVRYGNRWDGDVLVFIGEDTKSGKEGWITDQDPEKGGNRVLTHIEELGIPLYCFWAREDEEEWTYLGLGQVESWRLAEHDGKMRVEYRIAFPGIPSLAAAAALKKKIEEEVDGAATPVLKVPGGRDRGATSRRIRSQAFSDKVKRAYSERCAVCGEGRKDVRRRPEVQAAHIYPVEKDGPDDVRNGISLCRLHHWAFDGALFGIGTDLVLRVFEAGREVAGVGELDGRRLRVVPEDSRKQPHELFLNERFELSKVGWTRGDEGAGPAVED